MEDPYELRRRAAAHRLKSPNAPFDPFRVADKANAQASLNLPPPVPQQRAAPLNPAIGAMFGGPMPAIPGVNVERGMNRLRAVPDLARQAVDPVMNAVQAISPPALLQKAVTGPAELLQRGSEYLANRFVGAPAMQFPAQPAAQAPQAPVAQPPITPTAQPPVAEVAAPVATMPAPSANVAGQPAAAPPPAPAPAAPASNLPAGITKSVDPTTGRVSYSGVGGGGGAPAVAAAPQVMGTTPPTLAAPPARYSELNDTGGVAGAQRTGGRYITGHGGNTEWVPDLARADRQDMTMRQAEQGAHYGGRGARNYLLRLQKSEREGQEVEGRINLGQQELGIRGQELRLRGQESAARIQEGGARIAASGAQVRASDAAVQTGADANKRANATAEVAARKAAAEAKLASGKFDPAEEQGLRQLAGLSDKYKATVVKGDPLTGVPDRLVLVDEKTGHTIDGISGATLSPGTGKQMPAPTAPPPGAQPPPPAAIEYLKKHPETREAFKKRYGFLPVTATVGVRA